MIFLSYRSDDEPGYVGRLADSLGRQLGRDKVFQDRESLTAGTDWMTQLNRAIAATEVVIVVVGRHWESLLRTRQSGGAQNNGTDIVRHEILQARRQNRPIIVLTINDARLPDQDTLGELAFLGDLQHFNLRDGQQRWNNDVSLLTGAILAQSGLKPAISRRPKLRRAAAAALIAVLSVSVWVLTRPAPPAIEHASRTTLPLGQVAHDWQEGDGLELLLQNDSDQEAMIRLNNLAFPPGADSRSKLVERLCNDNSNCIECVASPTGQSLDQADVVSIRLKPDAVLVKTEMLAADGSNSWPVTGQHQPWEHVDRETGKRYVYECS